MTLGTTSNEKTGQSKEKERPIEGHESLCGSQSMPYWGLMKRLSYKGNGNPPTASWIAAPTYTHAFWGGGPKQVFHFSTSSQSLVLSQDLAGLCNNSLLQNALLFHKNCQDMA